MPPICSLLSMNGPSVVTISPPWWRNTVAEFGGVRPPLKIQTPAACISFWTACTSRMIRCKRVGWRLRAAGGITHGKQVLLHGLSSMPATCRFQP